MEVGPGKLKELNYYILKAGIKKITVFLGEGIKELFGDIIFKTLSESSRLEVLEYIECS